MHEKRFESKLSKNFKIELRRQLLIFIDTIDIYLEKKNLYENNHDINWTLQDFEARFESNYVDQSKTRSLHQLTSNRL